MAVILLYIDENQIASYKFKKQLIKKYSHQAAQRDSYFLNIHTTPFYEEKIIFHRGRQVSEC